MADIHLNLKIIAFWMTLSRNGRIHRTNTKLLPLKTSKRKTLDLHVNSGEIYRNYDGQPADSDIIFRPQEKDTQRWNVQGIVKYFISVTIKYLSSVLDEESLMVDICRCHLITRVFPLLKLWQSVREEVELNEEIYLGSIQCSIVSMASAFSGLSSYGRHRF